MATNRVRASWFVGGVLFTLFLVGLFWDVWRSYSSRFALERDVRRAVQQGAQHLPFKPREAMDAALGVLKEEGIEPKPGSVTVSPDGRTLTVSVISEATAYAAWIFGSTTMKFQAESVADVKLKGGGPVDQMQAAEVAFAIPRYDGFQTGQNVVVFPSGDTDLPDYVLPAWKLAGADLFKANTAARFESLPSLADYGKPQTVYVALLSDIENHRGTIKGFAALKVTGMNENGSIAGQFVRLQIDGNLEKVLPEENNFGLLRGGTPEVTFR